MEELKSLFGEGSLTYDEFNKKLGEAKETIKLANLQSGGYVDKAKYEKAENSADGWKTKYEALSESTKDYDELRTKYDALNETYTSLLAKQEYIDKENLVKSADVNLKFVEFVVDKVSKLTDDKKDFQTALKEFLNENKEFINIKKGNYVNLETGIPMPKTENEKMNNFIRSKLK